MIYIRQVSYLAGCLLHRKCICLVSFFCLVFCLLSSSAFSEQSLPLEDTLRLQAGDVIQVVLGDEEVFLKPLALNRKGRVLLPEVGSITLAGLTLPEAKEKVKTALSVGYVIGIDFSLSLVERRLPITILGYVNNPGPIVLPAEGNIQMALQLAGGLASGAQLDKLQVRRAGKLIVFDYKAYLDSGDLAALPELKSLDVLFVPVSPLLGNVQMDFDAATLSSGGDAAEASLAIKVFGEVNNPGIFSYKNGNTVVDVLMRAGGVTRYAGVEHIRIINKSQPVIFDLKAYLDSGNVDLLPKLKAGATVFVPKQEDNIKTGASTVYVMGEVFKPGAYESQEGMSFFDVLANAGGPPRFSESRQVRIIRCNGRVDEFDLLAYTEGLTSAQPPLINPGDAIFIPEKSDLNEKSWLKVSPNRAVRVLGAVIRPGRYEWSDEMSLLDLIAHAGGPSSNGDITQIKILNDHAPDSTITFNLQQFIYEGGDFNTLPKITAGSTIMVPELPHDLTDNKSRWIRQSAENSIYVFGQVGTPGRYAFNNKLGFLDILSAADGPTVAADIHHVHITHRNGLKAHAETFDLGLYFKTGDETLLPTVKAGDTIYLPEREQPWLDQKKENTVRVLGAINKPGRYRFDDSMTLLDLLAEAGGPTETAYLKRIVVVNLSQVEAGGDQSRSFNLEGFVKNPDFSQLPIVRVGDTVYVPDISTSHWSIFMDAITDIFKIVSVVAILGTL